MSESGTERGFTVRGIEPERHIYDFQITIDADFADELRALEVPEQQEAAAEHIEESLTHDMGDVRFVGDSFLLHGITVGFQATGLDIHNEERGRQTFATHNVDASSEAIEVISAFSTWEMFANRLVEDRREDDGLRADGGVPSSPDVQAAAAARDAKRRLEDVPNTVLNGHRIGECPECGERFEYGGVGDDVQNLDPCPGCGHRRWHKWGYRYGDREVRRDEAWDRYDAPPTDENCSLSTDTERSGGAQR